MSLFSRIIPKKDDFFGTKKLIFSTKSYELFTYDKKDDHFCNFKYSDRKSAKKIFNLLKPVKNNNIMNVISLKDATIQTIPLLPLKDLYNDLSESYKEYLMISLLRTIHFINDTCRILHSNITADSLYVNSASGILVLCGFEKAQKLEMGSDFSGDIQQFEDICFEFLHRKLEFEQSSVSKNFYICFFEKLVLIPVMKEFELCEFLNEVKKEQLADGIPDIVKKSLACALIKRFSESKELRADSFPSNLKKTVDEGKIENILHPKYLFLYYIISLDLDEYNEFFIEFIGVMDTKFRIEVLKNQEFFKKKVTKWSHKAIFDNISIGLRCKDDRLQLLTIEIFKDTLPVYKKTQIKEITKLLSFCKLSPAISLVENHVQIFIENNLNGLFKLFFVFIEEETLRKPALNLLKKTYKEFEPKILCVELLPFLCSMIVQSPHDELFETIRSILDHLQSCKDEIQSTEIKTKMQKWLPFLSKNRSKKQSDSFSENKIVSETELKAMNLKEQSQFLDKDQWEEDW